MSKELADVERDLSVEEQESLEDELLTLSHQLFLSGKDKDWVDYGTIDNDE